MTGNKTQNSPRKYRTGSRSDRVHVTLSSCEVQPGPGRYGSRFRLRVALQEWQYLARSN
jgi:hypothetical protein